MKLLLKIKSKHIVSSIMYVSLIVRVEELKCTMIKNCMINSNYSKVCYLKWFNFIFLGHI
jgi:hypothetical protein